MLRLFYYLLREPIKPHSRVVQEHRLWLEGLARTTAKGVLLGYPEGARSSRKPLNQKKRIGGDIEEAD
jgi:1-acyl-sn-glycerol-3-phosphate acyltransferase